MSTETHLNLGSDTGGGSGGEHSLHLRGFDREVKVPFIAAAGVAVAIVTILSFVVVWWGLIFMERLDRRHEIALSPIAAENPQRRPPAPILQVAPEDDMRGFLKAEDTALKSAAWIDPKAGTAQIPIDVAIAAIEKRGVAPLESAPPAKPTAPAVAATPPPGGRP
jgi:hypothetical protein